MKKLLLLLTVLLLALTVFVACGDTATTTAPDNGGDVTTTTAPDNGGDVTTTVTENTTEKVAVESVTDINVETDGLFEGVEEEIDGKVGGFDTDGATATYYFNGNYAGIYELEVFYLSADDEHRSMTIIVNGGAPQTYQVMECTDSWDNVEDARSFTIQIELTEGSNEIIFTKSSDSNGFNLVDFDLRKLYDLPTGDSITVYAPVNENDENDSWTISGGVQLEDLDNGDKKLGWLSRDSYATSTINISAEQAGEYLLAVYYLNMDKTYEWPRVLGVTVNGDVNYFQPVSLPSWSDPDYAVASYLMVTLEEGENTIEVGGGEAGTFRPDSGRTDGPCVVWYTLTAYTK